MEIEKDKYDFIDWKWKEPGERSIFKDFPLQLRHWSLLNANKSKAQSLLLLLHFKLNSMGKKESSKKQENVSEEDWDKTFVSVNSRIGDSACSFKPYFSSEYAREE